jgi:biotin carboxyl carrier protein
MKVEVVVDGVIDVLDVDVSGDGTISVRDGHTARRARIEHVCGSEYWQLTIDGAATTLRIRGTEAGADVVVGQSRVSVGVRRALPIPSRRTGASGRSDRLEVRAPMPGLVVAIPRSRGERVDAGMPVVVVEAMKMQMDVPAPTAGRIDEIRVRPGQEVMGGQVLVAIRSDGADGAERG